MSFSLKHLFAVITAICLFLGGYAAGKDDFDNELAHSEYWRQILQKSLISQHRYNDHLERELEKLRHDNSTP